ncbi:MAG: HNH endonuclease, partial [Stackebrandtia sp.]
HVDHVRAIADGGTWDEANLALMHPGCHDEKSRAESAARDGHRR